MRDFRLVALAAALLLSCTGKILGGHTTGSPGGPAAPPPACTEDVPQSFLLRMNATQYLNTEQDLFAQPSLSLVLDTNDASSPVITQTEVQDINNAAQTVVQTGGHYAYLTCAVDGGFNDACAQAFITAFGAKAWRRPLGADEVTLLTGVYQNVKAITGVSPPTTFQDAIDAVAEVMIQAPQHLYISAQGVADPSLPSGLNRMTGYERATKLSYFLTNSTPDDTLLQAAAAGDLDQVDALRTQAGRLLDSDRGHAVVQAFAGVYAGLEGDPIRPALEQVPKDSTKFPYDNPALRTAMRQEIETFYDHVLYSSGGSFQSLMTSTDAYLNGPLATLYGVSGGPTDATTFQWMSLDPTQRAGFFTRVAFLTEMAHQDYESDIHRGVQVFKYALCQPLGPPPPNVNNTVPANAGNPDGGAVLSVRGQTEERTAAAFCQSCHGQFNPIGFTLGNYGAMGEWQTSDVGTAADGSPFSVPVDVSADVPGTDLRGTVSGPIDLSTKLGTSPEAQACMAQSWLSQSAGRALVAQDACSLKNIQASFKQSGGDMHALVIDAATSAPGLYVRVSQ